VIDLRFRIIEGRLILECGGNRSATRLWMSDKLQFVDTVVPKQLE